MTHKAETILDAVVTAVTGLSTTGANVTRGRAYAVSAMPALSVYQGDDVVDLPAESFSYFDRDLEVMIDAHVAVLSTSDIEQTLNQIRAEVFAALRADLTLGGACIELRPVEDSQPQISGDQDKPIASQSLRYTVKYRHSTTSAEA